MGSWGGYDQHKHVWICQRINKRFFLRKKKKELSWLRALGNAQGSSQYPTAHGPNLAPRLLLHSLQAKNGLYILKWYNNKNQIRSYKSPCIMSVSVQKSVKPATCPLVTTHEGSEILSYLQAKKRGHWSVMGPAGDRRLQGQKIWTSSLP